jgi:hypothetical protein
MVTINIADAAYLTIINRALDLFNETREADLAAADAALRSAQARKEITPDIVGITPLAQSIAEFMSLSGPWSEDDGEFAGIAGYAVAV